MSTAQPGPSTSGMQHIARIYGPQLLQSVMLPRAIARKYTRKAEIVGWTAAALSVAVLAWVWCWVAFDHTIPTHLQDRAPPSINMVRNDYVETQETDSSSNTTNDEDRPQLSPPINIDNETLPDSAQPISSNGTTQQFI